MIPRWLTPAYWRAESRAVESMADPGDHSWDRERVECDRCGTCPERGVRRGLRKTGDWVSIVWRGNLPDSRVAIVNEDLLAVLCPAHADELQDKVRRAVAKAVRS